MQDPHFLGKEPIGRLLWKLSLPATVGMIVNALYNITDASFVGQGTGPMGLAGLSVAFPIQMLASAFALAVGVGSAALISIKLGEKKPQEAARIAGTAQVSGLVISLILLGAIYFFMDGVLKIFGASPGILPYARKYVSTVIWGFPLLSSIMVGNNLMRSEGKPNQAMILMLIGTGFNIILDPIFIFPKGEFLIGYFGMGIRGAALATVISQGLAFLYLLGLYGRKVSSLPLRWNHFRINPRIFSQSFVLGLPTFIRNSGTSLMVLIVNNSLIHYGNDLMVSSFGMINRLLMFSLMPIFGVVQGFQPIAGYNWGAKQFTRLKDLVIKSTLWTSLLSIISFFLMFLIPRILLRLFTQDLTLIDDTAGYLRRVIFFLPLLGIQFVGATYFQSVGKKWPSLFLGISRQLLLLPLLVLILPLFLGVSGIWFAFPAADVLATIITLWAMLGEWKVLNRKIQVSTEVPISS